MSDIQFVLDEEIRFLRKNPRDYEDKRDTFADLPHPLRRGAKAICGQQARPRLWKVAEDYLASDRMAGRVELATMVENLCYQISSRFLKKGDAVNKGTVQAALAAAVKRSASECKDNTHFIPCTVVSDYDLRALIFCRAIDFFIHLDLDATSRSPERLDEQFLRLISWAAEAPTMPSS